ncbi:MAG: tetratricopeptide repeat protein, partial [Chloroflexi bacterium]|nr:tetratricopeptide repeat protein [Chloroflexota bacterium]
MREVGMSLRIHTLGLFLVSRGDTPIPESAWKTQKNKTLLKILLTHRQHHLTRDQLLDWLWPDLDPDAADRSLRVATSQLREALEPDRPRGSRPSFLLTTEAGYAWNLQTDYWLDAEEFEELARSAALVSEEALDAETLSQLRIAGNLYQGDYLAEDRYADWALVERERLREMHLALLTRLAGAHARQREYPQAVALYRQVLAADRCRESVWRQVMLCHYHAGDQAMARRAYDECQQALREELDVEPMPETPALYAQILRREVPAPPSTIPHNLPPYLTPFIGRQEELIELAGRLGNPASRLVTLVGPGGAGKTRLALQSAGQHRDRFPQGVYFVPLAAVNSAGSLVTALASALRLFFAGRADPQAQFLDYLREKRLLLILDGFEHLLDETGLLVDILQRAPDVCLLVTSRERLHLQAEWTLEIGGLSWPAGEFPTGVSLAAYDAVQLFAERASRVRKGFALAQEGPAVVRICQLVAGLPLGIELAAPWVSQFTCREIAQEIERSLDFLATTMRDVPPPHRSLRVVFDRSWDLLSADERMALRDLSVFRGGFLREAAARVAGPYGAPAVLAALAAQSLLRASPTGRYEMHGLVRQYAAEKLAESPSDEEGLRDRHCAYYTDFLHQRTAALQGDRQREALDEIRVKADNVRRAWQWAVERGQCEALDRGLASLHLFYETQGWYQEGLEAFGRAAASLQGRSGGERTLGRVLARQARCGERLGLYERARELAQASLALVTQPDAAADRVFVLNTLGSLAYLQGAFDEAGRFYQESHQVSQESGDRYGAIRALYGRGLVAEAHGEYAAAKKLFQDSLALAQETADPAATARASNYLGLIACSLGEY